MMSASGHDLRDVDEHKMPTDRENERSPYHLQGDPMRSPGSFYCTAQRSGVSEKNSDKKNRTSVIAGDFIKVDTLASEPDVQAQASATSKLRGAATWVLSNHCIGNLMACVVVVDAMCTWIDIDARAAGISTPTFVEVFTDTALALYSLEILLRFVGKGLRGMVSDWLGVLDIVVVVCGYAEILLKALAPADLVARLSVMRALRLARIVRLLQFFRRIRSLRELQKLVTMMATCLRTLTWSFLLCFVIMTIWAMLLVEIVYPIVQEMMREGDATILDCAYCQISTSSVMEATLLLFKTVIAGDSWGRLAVPIIQRSPGTAIIFVGSLLSLVFGVLNIIVAVVVDTFAEARQNDILSLAEEMEHDIEKDRESLQKLFARIDGDGSGELTLQELIQGARRDPVFQSRLRVMDIDENDLQQLFRMIDVDGSGTIEVAEFIGPLSRWVHDSKTAPRFIKYNMLQTMQMQEDLYSLSKTYFGHLSERIDTVVAKMSMQHAEPTLLVPLDRSEEQQIEQPEQPKATQKLEILCQEHVSPSAPEATTSGFPTHESEQKGEMWRKALGKDGAEVGALLEALIVKVESGMIEMESRLKRAMAGLPPDVWIHLRGEDLGHSDYKFSSSQRVHFVAEADDSVVPKLKEALERRLHDIHDNIIQTLKERLGEMSASQGAREEFAERHVDRQCRCPAAIQGRVVVEETEIGAGNLKIHGCRRRILRRQPGGATRPLTLTLGAPHLPGVHRHPDGSLAVDVFSRPIGDFTWPPPGTKGLFGRIHSEVGKQNEALETLHHAILHKRWKNQWSPTLEKIIERHLQLCVELQKMRFAREGLHQYRATCQAANIQSLEQVVRVFRRAAEEKVNQAKKEQDVRLGKVADLEEMDAPETILLQAIQAGDTRQQSQDKDVHTHFRFLWETYKVILDVLKSNSRLEEVYHETSRQAFEFCRANTRPQEFKRLCDILRKNFQDLSKRTGPTGQNPVQPNNVDTITKTLETRCRQMQVATELDLWREAYNTSSEICDLMTALGKVNQRPKPHLRSMYYEHLGQIFWKSENYLFHAFASLKNVFFVKDATSDDGSAAEGYEPVRPLRFDALQRQQPPRRPEIDSSLEAEPPPFGEKGAEAGKQTEKETADCPICCEDLGRSPQEVGALTYQGKRIERDLYHVGCFTLMLSHKGAFSGERLKDGCFDNLKIAWGQSPTTRQEVDGFVSMPSMSDQKALIAFLDWKGTGRLDVSELATVAAVQLPLHARAMDNFIRENFQVDGDGNITVEELEQKVLPYIGEHFESITNAKEEEKKKAAKLRCDFLLMRLDSAVGGTIVASSTQSKWVQAALDELSQCVAQGDPIAVAVVSRLMTHPEPEAFESLSAALGNDSSQVRELVVE
ncbi:TIF3A1, partial [Symbiodinium sp. CCMP2456]